MSDQLDIKSASPNDPAWTTVEGIVERIVYENPETGYFVARLREAGNSELVTFVGSLMAVAPGETIRITGHWVDDKKFGRQIRTERYETVLPSSTEGIEKYLSSGLMHGIGKKFAKRLVKTFGIETLRIIDEHPEQLTLVEGIGRKRATLIRDAWEKQKSIQSIMVFLQGHGVGTAQAVRIYKQFGDGAVAVLRENPYRLADEISGIGFAGADAIAKSMGIEGDAIKRLESGLQFVLLGASHNGHIFLPRDELLSQASELLGVKMESLESGLISLVSSGDLVCEEDNFFLRILHEAETGCDRHLKRLQCAPRGDVSFKADRAVAWAQKEYGIELSEEQQEAIRRATDSKVLVVTGGPGTGKTTLIRCLLGIMEKKGLVPLLAAPTGRAAKRMEAATDHDARTIHRLLEYSPKKNGFLKDEYDPLNADIVVIDECSMVDVYLMHSLLRALPDHVRLFLVGDVDQLPSVGPGNILMDIIASNVIPTVRLKTVFRQAAQSGIIGGAHLINRGQEPEFNTSDFFFIERKGPERIRETILELITQRIPNKFGLDPLRDIQVLSPMHRGEAGVASLNEALQEALNPTGTPIPKRTFRLGDKVIQLRNNYELDVYNGDVGLITVVEPETQELHVQFDDRVVLYSFDDLDNLGLAYAITIHKSQGSEYPAVVLSLASQHFMLLQRNVLYTAITRGKQLVIIVGEASALQRALRTTDVTRRHTRLSERLRNSLR